jgi:hypothetical protein
MYNPFAYGLALAVVELPFLVAQVGACFASLLCFALGRISFRLCFLSRRGGSGWPGWARRGARHGPPARLPLKRQAKPEPNSPPNPKPKAVLFVPIVYAATALSPKPGDFLIFSGLFLLALTYYTILGQVGENHMQGRLNLLVDYGAHRYIGRTKLCYPGAGGGKHLQKAAEHVCRGICTCWLGRALKVMG